MYISSYNKKTISISIYNIIILKQYLLHINHIINKLSSTSFINMDQSSIIMPIKPISTILDE